MEKIGEWFGTPGAAARTLVWLCWVTFLTMVLTTALYLLLLGALVLVPGL